MSKSLSIEKKSRETLTVFEHMLAVMPDEPIRLRDWIRLLPEWIKPKTAAGEARLLVSGRFTTREPGTIGCYAITQKGQARRVEIQALLENRGADVSLAASGTSLREYPCAPGEERELKPTLKHSDRHLITLQDSGGKRI